MILGIKNGTNFNLYDCMTVVIDYHAGNLGSIKNMLKKLDVESIVSSKADDLRIASHLILPGVGSFDFGMKKLHELNLVDLIKKRVIEEKVPILGVCLGAQLFCKSSEEGKEEGLGFIDADVRKFPTIVNGKRYAVPHMGWDFVIPMKESRLLQNNTDLSRFYFVHSYGITCNNPNDILAANEYSMVYHSAFERDNILGVQFHPEKSHRFGKQLYKNFIEKY